MDNRTTMIVAVIILVALIGGYIVWENTRNDGDTTLDQANPNAPALTEPAAPGGGPMKQTP